MRLYNTLYKDFEEQYVGYSTVAIIFSSCLGSAAAMVILMNGHDFMQMFQLFLVVTVCLSYNGAIFSQMKPKFVFNSLILSVAVSSILLLINVWARY